MCDLLFLSMCSQLSVHDLGHEKRRMSWQLPKIHALYLTIKWKIFFFQLSLDWPVFFIEHGSWLFQIKHSNSVRNTKKWPHALVHVPWKSYLHKIFLACTYDYISWKQWVKDNVKLSPCPPTTWRSLSLVS